MADEATETADHFTAAELKFLVVCLQNVQEFKVRYIRPILVSSLTVNVQFDADAVATQIGYKDGNVVKNRWNMIKRTKIANGALGGGFDKKAVNKKAPVKRKKVEAECGKDGSSPPFKVKRGKKTTSAPEVKTEEAEDDEVVETTDAALEADAEASA